MRSGTLDHPTRRRNRPSAVVAAASMALACGEASFDAPAASGPDAGVTTTAAFEAGPPPALPSAPLVVPLRLHVRLSALGQPDLEAIARGINDIWRPAGVCFDVEVRQDDLTRRAGFDLFLTSGLIPGNETANGVFRTAQEIWTVDAPTLNPAPRPFPITTSRTAAHELGHGLGLGHQDCEHQCPCGASAGLDCDDLLMRSGTLGYALTPGEMERARAVAVVPPLDGDGSCAITFQ